MKIAQATAHKLRAQILEQQGRVVSNGGKLTVYYCHHCKKMILTMQPTKELVSSKGYWDSMTTCSNCFEMNFVLTYPSGKTISHKVPFMVDKKKGVYKYIPSKK